MDRHSLVRPDSVLSSGRPVTARRFGLASSTDAYRFASVRRGYGTDSRGDRSRRRSVTGAGADGAPRSRVLELERTAAGGDGTRAFPPFATGNRSRGPFGTDRRTGPLVAARPRDCGFARYDLSAPRVRDGDSHAERRIRRGDARTNGRLSDGDGLSDAIGRRGKGHSFARAISLERGARGDDCDARDGIEQRHAVRTVTLDLEEPAAVRCRHRTRSRVSRPEPDGSRNSGRL
ncbi:hypothetical protein C485_12618 [Natrinema altunense JCM 12890]|uniref:Uncharacterized protein n=1 Tax=Natrinema altunense (strain JCM 12890 / CGMCC 1.3731 / AJ2) TaxID=1227494 RepID=L9ZID2_NATA2|nr:hypothetical protein C485_12618 [Natrinema altunense JCM 12890]